MGTNSTSDVALVNCLFRWTLAASRILNVDARRRPRWEDILYLFPTHPVHNGSIVDFEEYPQRKVPFTDCLRVMPMWPTGDINLQSPSEQLELGWRTVAGIQGWWTIIAGSAARVGIGELAARHAECLQTLSAFSGVGVSDANPDGGVRRIFPEHHGGVGGLLGEMLLQSCGEAIHVFPAIPRNWQEVSFSRLRAEGAFLVSAERRKGETTFVEIVSERGGICVLANPWESMRWKVTRSSREVIATGEEGRIRFLTKAGECFRVESCAP